MHPGGSARENARDDRHPSSSSASSRAAPNRQESLDARAFGTAFPSSATLGRAHGDGRSFTEREFAREGVVFASSSRESFDERWRG